MSGKIKKNKVKGGGDGGGEVDETEQWDNEWVFCFYNKCNM